MGSNRADFDCVSVREGEKVGRERDRGRKRRERGKEACLKRGVVSKCIVIGILPPGLLSCCPQSHTHMYNVYANI